MSELNKKYLDLIGLQKYDGLIKNFIESGNAKLSDELTAALNAAIDTLDAKIGSLDFEGSDDKNLSQSIAEIYNSIAEIVDTQDALADKDAELLGKINGIIGELEEGATAMTLVEIANKFKAVEEDVKKNADNIAGVTSRVSAIEGTIEDLKNLGGENGLVAVVDKVNKNVEDIKTLQGEGEGSVKKIAEDAAAAAEDVAKEYADSLNTAMDARVKDLEAIDHEQLVADAIAAVVDNAYSDFDTLKEVADWIKNDKTGAAALQTTVSEHTESINTLNDDLDVLEAKVDGDIANLTQHITDAANALAQVETALDARIDVLEAFEETHESISLDTIEGLFA